MGPAITASLLCDCDEQTIAHATTNSEPDSNIAAEELAWWLGCQERSEIRHELAANGLL